MFKKKALPFIIFIAVALAAGGLSALLSMDGMREADSLLQPCYAPPAWLFPVVWTLLHILMGVSAALVWIKGAGEPESRRKAIWAWAIQLFLMPGGASSSSSWSRGAWRSSGYWPSSSWYS